MIYITNAMSAYLMPSVQFAVNNYLIATVKLIEVQLKMHILNSRPLITLKQQFT